MPADGRESLVPAYRQVAVTRSVVGHRVREPARHLELVIAPALEFGDGVLAEELRRAALGGRLPGYRLAAIFAEFERRSVFRIGPGAARTIETQGLVHAQKRLRTLDRDALLDEMLAQRLQRAPAAGGLLVWAYAPGLDHDPAPDPMS